MRRQQKGSSWIPGMGGEEDDVDEIPNIKRDDRFDSDDIVILSSALKEAEGVCDELDGFKKSIKEDVLASKENHFALDCHCHEAETWIAILRGHNASLRNFKERRDRGGGVGAVSTRKASGITRTASRR